MAFARSVFSVNRLMMSDSATAVTTAPPRPCTARAAMSIEREVATPQPTDAMVNRIRPIRNRRRLPNRSPRRPPSSRKPPNVSMYALTTQTRDVSVNARSSRMEGSATFTMVVSSTIIRTPEQRT